MTIPFSFKPDWSRSHWSRTWPKLSGQITQLSQGNPKQLHIILNTWLNFALLQKLQLTVIELTFIINKLFHGKI